MNRIIFNFIIMFFFNSFCLAQVNYSSTTLQNTMKAAKTNNKKILVYLTKEWCPACRLLEKQVNKNLD